jgi:hypothetical protein
MAPVCVVCEEDECDLLGGASQELFSLPPLPDPVVSTQRMEASGGVVVVFGAIAGINAIAFSTVNWLGTLPPAAYSLFQFFMAFLSGLALFCLCGVQLADPGVIPRTTANCFPQPEAIAARLDAGERMVAGTANPTGTHRGAPMSFCVRCFVWRPGHCHHCNTCQRCVAYFDHHCGVLGRCIAGAPSVLSGTTAGTTPLGNGPGNLYLFFYPLLSCAMAGVWTGIGFSVYAAVLWEYQRQHNWNASAANSSHNYSGNGTGLQQNF